MIEDRPGAGLGLWVFLLSCTPMTALKATAFAVFITVNMEMTSRFYMRISSGAKHIPVGGAALYQRNVTDFLVICCNKLVSPVYIYQLLCFCYNNPDHVKWDLNELTVWNTLFSLVGLVLIYDLFYAPFHRCLHLRSVYGAIHKYHHRQVAPIHGQTDGINTHPIEFAVGIYLHLLSVYLVPCHIATVVAYTLVTGYMASINHTRYDVDVWFYNVKAHDTHHKIPNSNYGQYTMWMDVLMGTYRPWTKPNPDLDCDVYNALNRAQGQRPPLPTSPAFCSAAACRKEREAGVRAQDAPKRCVVVGGNGLVGQGLVHLLLDRGAAHVSSVDTALPSEADGVVRNGKLQYVVADVTDKQSLVQAFKGHDVVFHVAALVGPYHAAAAYEAVNHQGTVNVVQACREVGVGRLVINSSPSTRLDGSDVLRGTEQSLKPNHAGLQEYARTKLLGERHALAASDSSLAVCAIAPHQVYGPRDRLFLPSLLRAALKGSLKIMGDGNNIISFCAVENVAHAMILAASALDGPSKSKVNGQFYIVTDGDAQLLWDAVDKAVIAAGLPSLFSQWHYPLLLLYTIAYPLALVSKVTGKHFNFTPFSIKMMTIHRHFDITKAVTELGYKPIQSFEEGWETAVRAAVARVSSKPKVV